MGTKIGSMNIGYRGTRLTSAIAPKTDPSIEEGITAIENDIEELVESHEPDEDQISTIKQRRDEIKELLENDFEIEQISIIGSYARRTMITNDDLNDIDMMITLS
ncbi:MAG: hypothetical protein ACXQTE_05825, partial [Methanosarcinaceae archaeon]